MTPLGGDGNSAKAIAHNVQSRFNSVTNDAAMNEFDGVDFPYVTPPPTPSATPAPTPEPYYTDEEIDADYDDDYDDDNEGESNDDDDDWNYSHGFHSRYGSWTISPGRGHSGFRIRKNRLHTGQKWRRNKIWR